MTQAKKFSFYLSLILMFFVAVGTTSCGDKDKDDDSSLEAPKYEKDAARFTITSPESPYSSIELTASGNYVIIEKGYSPFYMPAVRSAAKSNLGVFGPKKEAATRASSNGVIYGKYTKNSDGEYILEGFGTIKVESAGGTSVDLDITTLSGQNIVVGANRDNIMTESSKTNKLCRSWKISKVHVIVWVGSKKEFDKTLTIDEYYEMDGDDEVPENVIFTKAGTYLVTYKNGMLAISTWRWENEKDGILRYSWDYEHLDDEDASGLVNVKFEGNKLLIVEEYYDEEDGERDYVEWILTED